MIYDFGYRYNYNPTLGATSKKLSLLFILCVLLTSCKTAKPANYAVPAEAMVKSKVKSTKFMTGADNIPSYFNLLKNKKADKTKRSQRYTYAAGYDKGCRTKTLFHKPLQNSLLSQKLKLAGQSLKTARQCYYKPSVRTGP